MRQSRLGIGSCSYSLFQDPATQLRNGPQTATGQNVRILVRRCASPRSRISLVIFPSWIVQQHAQQALSRRERSRHSGGSLSGLGGSLGGLWRCTVDNEGNEGPRADADIRTVRRSTEACFFLRHQLVEFRLNDLIIPSLNSVKKEQHCQDGARKTAVKRFAATASRSF